MHFKWDKKYLYWGVTAFCVIAACTLFFLLLSNVPTISSTVGNALAVLTPVLYGFAIAYLMAPVSTFFEKKCFRRLLWKNDAWTKKRRLKRNNKYEHPDNTFDIKRKARTLSVLVTVFLELLVVFGLVWAVLPSLTETVSNLVNNLPSYTDEAKDWAYTALADYPDIMNSVVDFIDNIQTYALDWLKTTIMPQMSDVMSTLSSGIVGTIGTFLNIILGFVISIYFLHSKELFAAQGKKLLFSVFKPSGANTILRNLRHVHKTFGSFITGKLIDSCLLGVLYFIVLSIFGFPYALLASVIMGVTTIIPYFGPFIGMVPATLLILLEDPLYALYFVILAVVIQQLDGSVISPKIIGQSTGLSSFWVIFSLLIGQSIFGFIGLIIGIPLFAIAYSLVKTWVGRSLKKRDLPLDTNAYRQVAYIDGETGEITTVHEVRAEESLMREEEEKCKEAKRIEKRKHNRLWRFFRTLFGRSDSNETGGKNKSKK